MRWTTTLLTAGLAEAAARLLSVGWGFTVLVLAFTVVATRMTATAAAQKAKTYAVETRLSAHIVAAAPAINLQANGGMIGGALTVNGDHHIVGNLYGNGGTLSIGDATHMSANLTAAGAIYSHATLQSDSDANIGGQMNAAAMAASGAGSTGSTFTSHGNLNADGSLSASNFQGPYAGGRGGVSTVAGAPGSYSSAYETTLASAINGIIARLNSSGLS